MEINDSGEVVITEHDMITMPMYLNAQQSVLNFLQMNGAPISGKLLLKVMDGYDWSMCMEPRTYARTFTWRKR